MYEIENELLKEFGTKADFSYEVERRIRYFKIDYKYYKRVDVYKRQLHRSSNAVFKEQHQTRNWLFSFFRMRVNRTYTAVCNKLCWGGRFRK